MNLNEVKTLIIGTVKAAFQNKKTLDKFDGSSGTLKYNGVPVNNVPVFVADDSPVGNIISFMGNTVPKDYLICDGTEYNIADYPLLANHILNEFGSYNYFGGDGITTFAVPKITEINDTINGLIPKMVTDSNNVCIITQDSQYLENSGYKVFDRNDNTGWISDVKPDNASEGYVQIQFIDGKYRKINSISLRNFVYNSALRCKDFEFQASNDGINFDTLITDVLPKDDTKYYNYTVTSNKSYSIFRIAIKSTYGESNYNYGLGDIKLFGTILSNTGIKYQITQNNISKDMVNYSLEEQVIGSWIDGKPLYQKIIITTMPQVDTDLTAVTEEVDISALNVDKVVKIDGVSGVKNSKNIWQPINQDNGTGHVLYVFFINDILYKRNNSVDWNAHMLYITIQYTKTIDTENSFTSDMLSNISTLNTTASEEEVNEVIGGI